jgi:hypothetical protein
MKATLARYWQLICYTATYIKAGFKIIWSKEFRQSPGRVEVSYMTGLELVARRAEHTPDPAEIIDRALGLTSQQDHRTFH